MNDGSENCGAAVDTVDGSVIRRAPEVGSFFPLFTRFYTSQVVQDLFHQKYGQSSVFAGKYHLYPRHPNTW